MPVLANLKYETFCEIYAEKGHRHGTEAARIAGYKDPGRAAWQLLQRTEVVERIAEIRNEVWQRMEMSTDEIAARLARQSRGADIRKLYDASGKPLEPRQLDEEAAHAVAEYSEEETELGGIKRKIKLRDPTPALRTLAEMAGLIGPKVNVKVDVHADFAQLLDQARLRARTVLAEDAAEINKVIDKPKE
jgi:hypothetical protein